MTEPVDFFARLSDYGRAKNCCLLESREHLAGFAELSFGTAKPALYLTGTGADFSIRALTKTGHRIIEYLSTESHPQASLEAATQVKNERQLCGFEGKIL